VWRLPHLLDARASGPPVDRLDPESHLPPFPTPPEPSTLGLPLDRSGFKVLSHILHLPLKRGESNIEDLVRLIRALKEGEEKGAPTFLEPFHSFW